MATKTNITGIILAGGKSSRMGSDKALMQFNGKTFLEHVVCALKPLVDDILIVSDNPMHEGFGYSRVLDTIKDAGPLSAIHAGLTHSSTEKNLLLSCDVPLIETSVLEFLIENLEEEIDVIQLTNKEKSIPLVALYKKRVAPYFFTLLKQGERRIIKALNGLHTKSLSIAKDQ